MQRTRTTHRRTPAAFMLAIAFMCPLISHHATLAGEPASIPNRVIGTPTTFHILAFDQTTIDLGPVSDDDDITSVFRFTNTSTQAATLTIDGCHLCGLPTSDKPTYAPGERGAIFVVLHPQSKRGPVRAIGGIGVLGVQGSVVNLEVAADVRPRLSAEPEELTFNDVPINKGITGEAFIISRTSGFTIDRIECDHPHVRVTPGTSEQLEDNADPRTRVPIAVAIAPEAPEGELATGIRIHTSDPKRPELLLALRARIVGEAIAEPEVISLGTREVSSAFSTDFLVRGRKGNALQLRSLDIADSGLCTSVALDVTPEPDGKSWRVHVTGKASPRPIQHTEIIVRVECSTPDEQTHTLNVPVRMSVRAGRLPEN